MLLITLSFLILQIPLVERSLPEYAFILPPLPLMIPSNLEKKDKFSLPLPKAG